MSENSITLTAEQADAFRLDAELKQHAGNVVAEMFETARCLNEIKERHLHEFLGETTFDAYAEKVTGLKPRAVANYIKAYKTYGEDGLKKYGEIGITKLVALAQLNDTDRGEMLESGKAAELSSRELDEEIKNIKGENAQLKFDLEDAELSAKNNAAALAESRTKLAEETEKVKKLEKELAEAKKPVAASMTDEEKDEIRREAEKTAKKALEKDVKKLKDELAEREKAITEQAERTKELSELLEAQLLANSELQARAEKAGREKPVLSGSKEALKFCLEDIQKQFTRAVEIVGSMDGEEKSKFKAALVGLPDKLRAAAEGIE